MPGFMKTINQIARCAEQYRTDRLAALGLTGCQHSYILNICREPGISQEKLAKQICINKSNVARQLVQLEENGFVWREHKLNDKRTVAVYPTKKAQEVYPQVQKALGEWSQYITSGLKEEEKDILFAMLENMKSKAVDYLETGYIDKQKGGK